MRREYKSESEQEASVKVESKSKSNIEEVSVRVGPRYERKSGQEASIRAGKKYVSIGYAAANRSEKRNIR